MLNLLKLTAKLSLKYLHMRSHLSKTILHFGIGNSLFASNPPLVREHLSMTH